MKKGAGTLIVRRANRERMGDMTEPPVVVIGGGLTGAMMALVLAQLDYRVLVVERRSDPRAKLVSPRDASEGFVNCA